MERWIDGDDGWDQVPDEKDAGGGGRRKGGNSMTGMNEWSSNAGFVCEITWESRDLPPWLRVDNRTSLNVISSDLHPVSPPGHAH